MQAMRVVFPAPHQVRLESYEVPDRPAPGELLLRALTTAISPGTELIVYTGRHSSLADPSAAWPKFPFQPGYCFVGEVIGVGEEVRGFSLGDRVATRLGHASYGCVQPERMPVLPVPQGLTDEEAALVPLAAISLNGVRLAAIELGETAVVAGLGLIGLFAAQLAHVAGAGTVLGADLVPARRQTAEAVGIPLAIDPSHASLGELVRSLTQGRGADVVIDATGSPKAAPGLMDLARVLGRYIVLGSPHGTVEIDLYHLVHRQCLRIVGAHERSAGWPEGPTARWTNRENLVTALQFMAQGRIHAKELITDVVTPSEAAATYPRLVDHPAESLGVVFDWRRS
ncbi:MAG: zinc-dependent alcohol dehydrogenase [Anaerolineae bacterium]